MTNKLLHYKNGVFAYTFATAVMLGVSVVVSLLNLNGISTSDGVNFWLINGAYSICLGGVALLILRLTKQPLLQTLGIKKDVFGVKKIITLIALVVVLLNVMAVVNNWFASLLTRWGCNLPSGVTREQILANPILAVVVACILPAINEELIFRGLLAKGLAQKLGNLPAVLLTGLLFALFHGSPLQTLHQFVLGCLLSMVAISSGSVVLPVLAHLFNNVVALVLALYVEPTNFYVHYKWLVLGIGGALLAALGYLCIRQFKLPQSQVEKANTSPTDLLLVAVGLFSIYLWVGAL